MSRDVQEAILAVVAGIGGQSVSPVRLGTLEVGRRFTVAGDGNRRGVLQAKGPMTGLVTYDRQQRRDAPLMISLRTLVYPDPARSNAEE